MQFSTFELKQNWIYLGACKNVRYLQYDNKVTVDGVTLASIFD